MRKQFLGAVVAATTALLGLGTLPAPAAHAVDPLGAISGTVTAQVGGLPLDDITVVAFQQLTQDGVTVWAPVAFAETQPTGTYLLYAKPGTYRLEFVECAEPCADPTYAPEFYNDVATVAQAQDLTVTDNQVLPGINAALAPGYLVAGHVTGPDAEAVTSGTVAAYTPDGSDWEASYGAKLSAGGAYAMVVPAGSYRFGFFGKGRNYAPEYHTDKATVAAADTVVVGADKPNLDAQLALIQVQNNPSVQPTVNGVARVGSTLAATSGAWLPQAPQGASYSYTYQWFRSGSAQPIGAGTTLVVPQAAQGETITVRVTATLDGYTGNTATSAPTTPIAPALTALKATAPPAISGVLKVGETLKVSRGTWEKEPTDVTYQWYADLAPVPGATQDALALTPGLVGKRLSVAVAAITKGSSLPGYSSALASGPVRPGTLTVATAPMLQGRAKVGRRLKVRAGATLPASATVEIQWLVRGKPVVGGTRTVLRLTRALRGAKVRAQVSYAAPGYEPVVVRTRAVRVR